MYHTQVLSHFEHVSSGTVDAAAGTGQQVLGLGGSNACRAWLIGQSHFPQSMKFRITTGIITTYSRRVRHFSSAACPLSAI